MQIPLLRGRLFDDRDPVGQHLQLWEESEWEIVGVVGRRTREIGIRQALGAGDSKIPNMILRDSLLLVLPGILIGLVGWLLVGKVLTSVLHGVNPAQPFVLISVAIVLVFIAVAAAWLPARRASLVDPLEAIRAEW